MMKNILQAHLKLIAKLLLVVAVLFMVFAFPVNAAVSSTSTGDKIIVKPENQAILARRGGCGPDEHHRCVFNS